jgi:hypothetical protein
MRWLSALALLLAACPLGQADVLPFFRAPRYPVLPKNNFALERAGDALHAKLIVPRHLLPKAESARTPDPGNGGTFGLLLSASCLSAALFGLTLLPRRRLVSVILLLAALMTGPVWANMPLRGSSFDFDPPPFGGFPAADVRVQVVIAGDGDTIRLVLPASIRPAAKP